MSVNTNRNDARAISQAEVPQTGFYSWYVVLLLTLCYTLAFLDAKILYIMTEVIKSDLMLSDTQIGLVTGPVFSLTYAICAIPIARISDRYSRKYVIGAAVIVWSGFTAAGGLAQSFGTFMLSRTGVAMGEAACTPAAHSLISDYVPQQSRAKAMSVYATGIALGSFLALVLGGILIDAFGWRATLFVIGSVGIFLTILVQLTLKEPPRTHMKESAEVRRGSIKNDLLAMFADPAIRNILLGGTLICFMLGATNAWLAPYTMRHFGLSATETGASLGLVGGTLAIFGILAGGILSDWLSKKNPRYGFWFLSGSFVLAFVFKISGMLADSFPLFLGLTAFSSALVMFYPGPTFASVQALAHPEMRSFASAVAVFCLNGLGIASGTFVTGWLSDLMAGYFGAESLRWAIVIVSFAALWAAMHYYMAGKHLTGRQLR